MRKIEIQIYLSTVMINSIPREPTHWQTTQTVPQSPVPAKSST
jgi:hypothetical protein